MCQFCLDISCILGILHIERNLNRYLVLCMQESEVKMISKVPTSILPGTETKIVYCLYRVSTKGQVEKNDIPMQKNACREFAKNQSGWVIKKEFQEQGVSGFKVSANDRDAVQELKTAAENHEFDILLVFMFDRIGRIDNETPFVVEWFINHGIQVWSVNEGEQRMDSHVDKLMNYIRFWQANGESQKTSMRVKTRLHQLVADGIYTGGCAPFGYRLVKSGLINKKGKELMTLKVDPIEAEIVITIFEKTVKEGYGSYVLAEYINDMGVRTHNGARFQANTIKRILQNSIYCGFYVRGGVTSKRIDDLQIIDDVMFSQAKKILEQRKYSNEERTQIARSAKSSTMIGGNIYCAHCGHKLCANSFVDTYKTKDGAVHKSTRRYRYLCSGKAMKRNDCNGQSVYSASKVDKVVVEILHKCFDKIKSTPKAVAIENRHKIHTSQIRKEIRQLTKESETLKRKLGELTAEIANSLIGESDYTPELLTMAIEDTKHKIADNVKLISEKENQLNHEEDELKKIDYYYEQFISWANEFDDSTPERKKMIICTLFKEITVGKGYEINCLMDSSYKQFLE